MNYQQLEFLHVLTRSAYLRLSKAVQVGNVKHAAHSGGVHPTSASLLKTQVVQDLTEARILRSSRRNTFNMTLVQEKVSATDPYLRVDFILTTYVSLRCCEMNNLLNYCVTVC